VRDERLSATPVRDGQSLVECAALGTTHPCASITKAQSGLPVPQSTQPPLSTSPLQLVNKFSTFYRARVYRNPPKSG
jgi:hypothetical protein